MTGFVDRAIQYAADVIEGKLPACLYVRQACDRFEKDLQRALDNNEIWFDPEAVESKCGLLEKLPHVKGVWAARKETFSLSEYQIFVNANIFGFKVVKDGERLNKRRFREAYIEVPRKNGKTFWIAGIGLSMLAADNEFGAEVYCGATSEGQAYEVFSPAKLICERKPAFAEYFGVEAYASSIVVPANGSKFRPIIGNPGDGASPSCGIADEFHEHKTSDQVDTLVTGMGAREQPLMIYITTAGSDMGGPCYAKRDDIKNVLSGAVVDDNVFGIIYTIDEGDDWDTVDALKKANPNFGISVQEDALMAQLAQARRSATKQAAYKTKHLNMWVGAKSAWMNMLAFQACRKKSLNMSDFKGRKCIVAFDLASRVDIASRAVLFPPEKPDGKFAAFVKHYLPEDVIFDGGNTRYKAWHADGWLDATGGNTIDFEVIEEDLRVLASECDVSEVPYDPFQATEFSTRMAGEGLPMIEIGQTVKNFSEPMKELEMLVLKKKIDFEYDPVLMWMFGNVVAKLDKKDNIFPNKERAENKIDGVVALIMAVNRAMANTDNTSIYEDRGILTF